MKAKQEPTKDTVGHCQYSFEHFFLGFNTASQLFCSELYLVWTSTRCVLVLPGRKTQRPAVNEKLAASLNLLREVLLLGLSEDNTPFVVGCCGG